MNESDFDPRVVLVKMPEEDIVKLRWQSESVARDFLGTANRLHKAGVVSNEIVTHFVENVKACKQQG